MADAQKLVPFILSWEGGYVNDPTMWAEQPTKE